MQSKLLPAPATTQLSQRLNLNKGATSKTNDECKAVTTDKGMKKGQENNMLQVTSRHLSSVGVSRGYGILPLSYAGIND